MEHQVKDMEDIFGRLPSTVKITVRQVNNSTVWVGQRKESDKIREKNNRDAA